MYFIPGYVSHYEEDGAIFVTSELYKNTVKLTDPQIMDEFYAIVRNGGCADVSTELTHFLHEQELLVNEQEAKNALDELRGVLNNSLLVTIMPTEGCNFRCPYCYESHEPIAMRRKTLDHICAYITKQADKFKNINISWFGGEPTLCKDMVLETAEVLQSLQKQYGIHYTSSMTTNGYLLNLENFLLYYNAGITSYQITLDGWNHDKTRPHVTGKGTLQTIIDNLSAISALPQDEYKFHITLRYNILPDSDCENWYDHLYRMFGHDSRFSVLVRPVGDWGGETVDSLNLLTDNNAETVMRKHVDYLRKIGMLCENQKKSPLSQVCYASYPHSMVFRAGGLIEKCTVCLDHPKNRIGFVDDEQGVLIDAEANRQWSGATLKSSCYHCANVTSCLNMQCRNASLIGGIERCNREDSLLDVF